MTDVVLFLKAAPPSSVKWPSGTKALGLDPRPQFACGGADALCSTAFSQLYSSLKDASGRVVPNLMKRVGVTDLGKLVFVSYSAGHGFMNPFLANAADRAATSDVVLMDSTFGGGKTGYVAAAKDAAAGRMLLVSVTSDKGSTDTLNNGDYAFREAVLKPAGLLDMPTASAVPPMPNAGEGVFHQGGLWYYRYKDAEAHHWELGKLLAPVCQAHVLPLLAGAGLGGGTTASKTPWLAVGAIAAGVAAYMIVKRPPLRENPRRRRGGRQV